MLERSVFSSSPLLSFHLLTGRIVPVAEFEFATRQALREEREEVDERREVKKEEDEERRRDKEDIGARREERRRGRGGGRG